MPHRTLVPPSSECARLFWGVAFLMGLLSEPLTAQNIGTVTPSPFVLTSPTAADFTNGKTAEVNLSIQVTMGGGKSWTVLAKRGDPYASPLPDTLWVRYHNTAFGDVGPERVLSDGTSARVYASSGNVTFTRPFWMELNNASDGTFTSRLEIYVQNNNTNSVSSSVFVDVTITISGSGSPTISVSTTSASLGTAAASEFIAGVSAAGTVTVSVTDANSVGTTLYAGMFDPGSPPYLAAGLQGRVDSGTWTTMEPRGSYTMNKACTGSCDQVWDIRKLVSWTGDPPASIAYATLKFELRKTSDGTVLSTQDVSVDLTVAEALYVSMPTSSYDAGTATSAGYRGGDVTLPVNVGSNLGFDVAIKGNSSSFSSASGLNNTAKGVGDLEWADADFMSWQAVGTTDMGVKGKTSAHDPASTPGGFVPLRLRINIRATDPKDTYTIYITLSILSNSGPPPMY